jgi:predicted HTH transcriptional regulator
MANTAGGYVLLGVRELVDGTLEVVGIADPDRVERDLWNQLNNQQKISTNLLGREDVQREVLDGATLLIIHVPRAPRTARPVFVGRDVWTGTYIRTHDGDRVVRDRERIRRMIAEAEYDARDDRVWERFGTADLAADTIAAYRNYFRSTRGDHPWLTLNDGDFLRQIGAYRHDREAGTEGLTSAGLLMFGQYDRIREVFPNYFPDYQERPRNTGAIEWTDRVYADGTWSGNLYDFYRKTVLKLTAELKVPYRLRDDLYRAGDTHVHEALREALVNALIHADYEGRIGLLVTKEPGVFTFRNPGGLRLSVEEIRAGGRSDCRNRTLQRMFLMLGLGEQAGSGFSRILRAWREQQWQVPLLSEDVDLDVTTLRLNMTSLLPAEVVEDLEHRFGPDFHELPGDGRMALALASEPGGVTHERLVEVTGGHPRDLTLLLQTLLRKGMVERDRPGRGCTYRTAGPPGDVQVSLFDLIDAVPAQTAVGSPQTSPQSSSNAAQSSAGSGRGADVVARVAASRWAPRADVQSAILAACQGEFRTAHDLAALLKRSARTLQQHYLRLLVAEGRLVLRFPELPNHPEQGYRSLDQDVRRT